MKQILLILSFSLLSVLSFAQTNKQQYFMLSGASFAIPENSWFEMGCDAFNARSINKAVSGNAIMDAAVDMFNNVLYTPDELEKATIFVIMQVHNEAVANELNLKENYKDYTLDQISTDYAVAYDYVIKRYKDDCYKLKNNPTSQYYGSENGKPAIIVLCTHWHDSRTIYNSDIRKLAAKWNFPLVKFDENIGFTKDVLVDGKQPSLQYASDTQTIDGVTYGQHPFRGRNQYIQQKMAQIFIAELENVLGKIPPTAILNEKSRAILPGEDAYVSYLFLGSNPYNLNYSVNGLPFYISNITQNPILVKVKVDTNSTTTVVPLSVSNNTTTVGVVSGKSSICYADKTSTPILDTYVHQVSNTTSYETAAYTQIKGALGNYSRESYFCFRLNNISESDEKIIFRAYLYKNVYSGESVLENHLVEISGDANTYSTITWDNKPVNMTIIGESMISPADINSYISWDITDWAKQQKKDGKEVITLRLKVINYGTGLLYFYSSESSSSFHPQLLITSKTLSAIKNATQGQVTTFYNPLDSKVHISGLSSISNLSIFSAEGTCYFSKKNISSDSDAIDMMFLPKGVYLLSILSKNQKYVQKIIKSN